MLLIIWSIIYLFPTSPDLLFECCISVGDLNTDMLFSGLQTAKCQKTNERRVKKSFPPLIIFYLIVWWVIMLYHPWAVNVPCCPPQRQKSETVLSRFIPSWWTGQLSSVLEKDTVFIIIDIPCKILQRLHQLQLKDASAFLVLLHFKKQKKNLITCRRFSVLVRTAV